MTEAQCETRLPLEFFYGRTAMLTNIDCDGMTKIVRVDEHGNDVVIFQKCRTVDVGSKHEAE